jgi:hypothetical protein
MRGEQIMSTELHSPLDTKPSVGGVIKNGAIAGVIGIVINAILYFIGAAMGAFPPTVLNPAGQPITIVSVITVGLVGAIAGTIGYLILSRIMVQPLANRWFVILAVIVLIGMAFTPFTLPGAPTSMIVFLEIMHLVIGGALIYYLPRSA